MLKAVRVLPVLGALVLLAATASSAYGSQFDMTWNGGYGSGSAVLTATLVSGDEYDVTSLSGTQAGLSLTLLLPDVYGSNNNEIFYPGSPSLDLAGLSFTDGTNDYNIFWNTYASTPVYTECSSAVTACHNASGAALGVVLTSFSLTPVSSTTPEPSSLILLATGLFGLAGAGLKRLA